RPRWRRAAAPRSGPSTSRCSGEPRRDDRPLPDRRTPGQGRDGRSLRRRGAVWSAKGSPATDLRRHRGVALKLLPPIFAADPAYRQRFEREAQAVAALNHPNIVTIHSVEEDSGRLLRTMELVEGRPLSELILPGGLPLERLLRIGAAVADAQAAAPGPAHT